MKPESRAALLKAQAAIDEAYLVCLREAVEESTTEKRAKIAAAIRHLPDFANSIAQMVDPKPPTVQQYGQLLGFAQAQQADQRLFTQGGGIVKDTAAW